MKKWCFAFLALVGLTTCAQTEVWAYLRARDTLFEPDFSFRESVLTYTGTDIKLKTILEKYTISTFKKTYRTATKEHLKKTFFIRASDPQIVQELLEQTPHLFEFGEIIAPEDHHIFEPNDYGLTSTVGENLGLQARLDYYDFIDLPKAWYYTTGHPDVIIGISDGLIDTTDVDFQNKTRVIRRSGKARGHGDSVAATAAAKGNNGAGFVGVCSDCSIYGTTYGNFKTLSQLVELSNLGVQVINCSWGSKTYYQTAQDAINEMFENGTVIVAAAHNKPWQETNGEVFYYPASYDNVISVSSVMHRYEKPLDNLLFEKEKNSKPYVENIRGYVGRTAGFTNDDTTTDPYIYPISTKILNTAVDILGPAVGLLRYGEITKGAGIDYSLYSQTSGVTPMVSGTVGLMFSLYPCLPVTMVDPILKVTATNIDSIPANKRFAGKYGAGSLNAGRAVKLTHDLFATDGEAVIQNQHFTRWVFPLQTLSRKLTFKNQTFTDAAQLTVTAKHKIILEPGTSLRPNEEGKSHFYIDSDLEKQCDLRLRAK